MCNNNNNNNNNNCTLTVAEFALHECDIPLSTFQTFQINHILLVRKGVPSITSDFCSVAVDGYMVTDTSIGWGMEFGSLEKRPAFVDYWSKLKERDAVKRAAELDDALIPKAAD